VNGALAGIAELIRGACGIHLRPNQHSSLRAAIARIEPGADPAAFLRLVADPAAGRGALDRLIEEVTVNETFFFRERRALEAISWPLLLERAHARGSSEIRVWSAACSTGEEAYTLAIMACEAFAPVEPPVRILATDISTQVVARAWEGHYRERAVRGVEPALRSRYFNDDDGLIEVGARPRRHVEFARHNLALDPIPPLGEGPFDLIVCRNVLIYFDPATVERVIAALEGALHPDGMLILGAADTLCGTTRRLAQLALDEPPSSARRAPPLRAALRRPLGRTPEREATVEGAVRAASEGRRADALADTAALLTAQPLDADASFVRGLVLLESGSAAEAAAALRRALYVDPTFGLAAFQLGRAYDELGDIAAAKRSYGQALRALEPEDDRHDLLLGQVDLGDIAAAAQARLEALR
jgi:chemotaxis protein methyltransferase CheR